MGLGTVIDALSAAGWSTVSAFRGAMALWGVCALLAYLWFCGTGAGEAAPGSSQQQPPIIHVPSGLLIIAHAPLASSRNRREPRLPGLRSA